MTVEHALAYGVEHYCQGSDGKTLLVIWQAERPLVALAAGLATDADRERFSVLSRYLVRREKADAYWLLLGADMGGAEHLVAEVAAQGRRQVVAAPVRRDANTPCFDLGQAQDLGAGPVLGNLLEAGSKLPAVMRRDLDRLAEQLAIALPAAS